MPTRLFKGRNPLVTIEIVRLQPDSWEALREIRLRALQEAPYAFGQTYEDELPFDEKQWRSKFEHAAWFLATSNGIAIGIVAGIPSLDEIETERDAIAMWIDPDHRGSGVANLLVTTIITWAREDGAQTLGLWFTHGNERARGLYERHGFIFEKTESLERDPSLFADKLVLEL